MYFIGDSEIRGSIVIGEVVFQDREQLLVKFWKDKVHLLLTYMIAAFLENWCLLKLYFVFTCRVKLGLRLN